MPFNTAFVFDFIKPTWSNCVHFSNGRIGLFVNIRIRHAVFPVHTNLLLEHTNCIRQECVYVYVYVYVRVCVRACVPVRARVRACMRVL